jgi:hypothetical protein
MHGTQHYLISDPKALAASRCSCGVELGFLLPKYPRSGDVAKAFALHTGLGEGS